MPYKNNSYIFNFSSLLIISLLNLLSCQRLDYSTQTKSKIDEVIEMDTLAVMVNADVFDLSNEIHKDYGICYSNVNQKPTISDSVVSLGTISVKSKFSVNIIELQPATNYYFRAFVMDGSFPIYSLNAVDFSTRALLPVVLTKNIIDKTSNTATGTGNILNNGGADITEYGLCWSENPLPSINDNKIVRFGNTDNFTIQIEDLRGNTTYYVRAFAKNSSGTAYGNEISFTTLAPVLPNLTTNNITEILSTSAIGGGNITSDGGAFVNSRGVCWSTYPNPTIEDSNTIDGSGKGNFSSNIENLELNTFYYLRAYATNDIGTSYGNEVTFTTILPNGFQIYDIDSNEYHVINIGGQTWLQENLKTSRLNDGTILPLVNNSDWINTFIPAYSWYFNDEANFKEPYGAFYNWLAVNTKKLCPTGWHVPDYDEWMVLFNNLGGAHIAGGKLKEKGFSHWVEPNQGATDEAGFHALPAGTPILIDNGSAYRVGYITYLWSSSLVNNNISTMCWILTYNNADISVGLDTDYKGYSVRCIKDQ